MARSFRMPPVGAFVLALACAGGSGTASAQSLPDDTIEVLSVSFEGARAVPATVLRSAIGTVPTRCVSVALQPLCWAGLSRTRAYLDKRAVEADVFRLRVYYYQRGYREAQVTLDTTRVSSGVHVRFSVDEGRPVVVRSVAIVGAEAAGGRISRGLPVRIAAPFSMIEFEAARDTITARLANRGHATGATLANYVIAADDPYQADVVYEVLPGPLTRFGPIEVAGATRVSPTVVRRMLTFAEGDLFSRQALLRSQRNLFGLDVFRHAEITAGVMPYGDSVLPIRVQVNEGDLHRVRLGAGLSTVDFTSVEGRWISRNFLGGARRLELRGRLDNMLSAQLRQAPFFEACTGLYCDVAGQLSLDFTQPWFFDPLNTFGAGVFVERFTLPDVYVRDSQGAHVTLSRAVGTTSSVSIGYRAELTELDSEGDLIYCINFVACEDREIDVLRDAHSISPIAISFVREGANSLFSPTAGINLRFDGEYAARATGSDFGYARAIGELSAYHDPFRGVVLASRLRPGWARAFDAPGTGIGLHPQKRFFAGGPNSVRGFAQYRLGPRLLTVDADTLLQPIESGGAGCTAQEVNAGTCDVESFAEVHPGAFVPRPVGGTMSLEGNVEVRFPIRGDRVRGAAFVDFGQVWRSHEDVRPDGIAWTPGAGIRYFSPIGPIRIDIGYNPAGSERLDVVTTEVCHRPAGSTGCLDLESGVTYVPGEIGSRRRLRSLAPVTWRPLDSFTDRLQLHFSIGQAF